jgi:polar amino acid transport system permease protein/polar amino acid transport system substrate-binding protein
MEKSVAIAEGGNMMNGFLLVMDQMPLLLKGAWKTIELAIFSLFFAAIIGLVFGLFRVSRSRLLRAITKFYVSLIRGTPLYVQLIFFYFGVFPLIIKGSIEPTTAGIFVLSINAGAYLVEIFRGGIESIDRGQMEAGRASGLSYWQTMRHVILPQAVKRMIPAFLNQFIISLKDTSLFATIGVAELTYTAQTIYSINFKAFQFLTAIAVMYWIIITLLTWMATFLEKRWVSE